MVTSLLLMSSYREVRLGEKEGGRLRDCLALSCDLHTSVPDMIGSSNSTLTSLQDSGD